MLSKTTPLHVAFAAMHVLLQEKPSTAGSIIKPGKPESEVGLKVDLEVGDTEEMTENKKVGEEVGIDEALTVGRSAVINGKSVGDEVGIEEGLLKII
jgi:UDP-3-O-[3-hydroxymyristoyl] glucosamine N-acyltransferase